MIPTAPGRGRRRGALRTVSILAGSSSVGVQARITPSAIAPARRSIPGLNAPTRTGIGASDGSCSRKPRTRTSRPSTSTRSPATTARNAAADSRIVASGARSSRPCQSSTIRCEPAPSPAATRPGASEASVAKAIPVRTGERL